MCKCYLAVLGVVITATTGISFGNHPIHDVDQLADRVVKTVVMTPELSHIQDFAALDPGVFVCAKQKASAGTKVSVQEDDGEQEFNPQKLMSPIRAIKNVPIKSVDQANQTLSDADLVLGVEVDGHARAYPITMLCGPQREIINDNVGNSAIAATW